MAHKWAKWLPHPCRIGDPRRFKAGGKIRSGPQVGKVATSPLPYRGAPPLQSGGQNQKWPTSGQSGYLTPAVSGIPTASKRGAKSEVAHKWAKWLPHPCRIRDPHHFKAGGKIRNVQKKGGNATSPLHCGGSLAKGTKSKVAELGASTKLWMWSPKEQHQKKKIAQMMCVRRKTPLKPPLGPFLKKGGGFKTPHGIGFLRNPPPLGASTSSVWLISRPLLSVCVGGGGGWHKASVSGGGQDRFLLRSLVDGAGSYSVPHRAGLLPTELTGMWGWILLRSLHVGSGSPPAPAPTKQRPAHNSVPPCQALH